jgi:hypothetical protein
LLSELKKFWKPVVNIEDQSKQSNLSEARLGVVKKILHDNEQGKNGFITSDGIDLYFTLPIHIGFCKNLIEGCSVKFVEMEQQVNGKKRAKIIKIN